jgi:purine-binding chemotaxis protein CheW
MIKTEEGFRSLFDLKKDRTRREEEILFLGFSVGTQAYAVKIPLVREILKVPRLYSMPKVPAFVKGVMDLRGQIMPVVDLKERLDLGSVDLAKGRVVILNAGACPLGFLVDRVLEVFSVPPSSLRHAPEVFRQPEMAFIEGMVRSGESFYLLLDPGSVLTPREMKTLEAQAWDARTLHPAE